MRYAKRKELFDQGLMTPAQMNAEAGNTCVFIIGNTLFGRPSLDNIKDCPFDSVEELEKHLLEQWNRWVNDWDTVIIVGGFAVDEENVHKYAKLLKGKKMLIKGEYDLKDNKVYYDAGFTEVYSHPIIFRDKLILTPKIMRPETRFKVVYSYMPNGNEPIPLMDNLICVAPEYVLYKPTYVRTLMQRMKQVKMMLNERRKCAQKVQKEIVNENEFEIQEVSENSEQDSADSE